MISYQLLHVLLILITLIKTSELYDSLDHRNNERDKRESSSNYKASYNPTKTIDVESEITKCFEEPKMWCSDKTRYRSIDGRCNNLNLRSWGMAYTAMFRILPARYKDDICLIDEKNSPSALKIGQIISHIDTPPMLKNVTTFFAIFAQIVVEDVTSFVIKSTSKNFCCSSTTNTTYDNPSCDCMPTDISQSTGNCTKFVRSTTTYNIECPAFPVHQLSSVTSFLDASFLYSSHFDTLENLRTKKNGKLRSHIDTDGRPFTKMFKNFDVSYDTDRPLVHINIGTRTLQTMFLRLHNFLCEILSWTNPSWDDETVFQEARRLLVAMYQHIVYFEFLPIIIGYEYAEKYDLMPKRNKLQENYDAAINPSTVNSFTTAAFRYFHAFIPASFCAADKHYDIIKNISFISTSEDINITDYDWYDSVIRGSTTNSILESNRLESQKRLLLHATDTERARDHGLASYNDYREACGLERFSSFERLHEFMKSKDVLKLQELYDDIDEVELYVGGMLENPEKDAMVGSTFQCLIAEAFYRYKYGDRFFYEHKHIMGQFTKEQLYELKKVTASLLVCISSDAILKVQSNIFYLPSKANPFLPCELILRPDYTKWQEKLEKSKF